MLPWKIFFLQNDSIIVDNSARRQCIVFLSLLVVLFEGNLLEWGQLFSRKIYGEGAIFHGGNFVHGQLSSGAIIREAIFLGEIVLEPWINIEKKKDFLQKFLLLLFYQSFLCLIMRNTFSDWLNAFRSFYSKLIPDYSIWQALKKYQ